MLNCRQFLCILSFVFCIIADNVALSTTENNIDENILCVLDNNCPLQPSWLQKYFFINEFGTSNHCIFRTLLLPNECMKSKESKVIVRKGNAVPDSTAWSRCQHCVFDTTTELVNVWHSSNTKHGTIDMAYSNWKEFFFNEKNDRIRAQILLDVPRADSSAVYVDRPVFLISLITLHVGHVIIDLIEQVYVTMLATYGEIRSDALLLIEVASSSEQYTLPHTLHDLFATNVGDMKALDSYGAIIGALSEMPIIPYDVLIDAASVGIKQILFADMHIGVDGSAGHFAAGYLSHSLQPSFTRSEAVRLKSLQNHIASVLNAPNKLNNVNKYRLALVIDRKKTDANHTKSHHGGYLEHRQTRKVINFDEMFSEILKLLCPRGTTKSLADGAGITMTQCRPPEQPWQVLLLVLEDIPHSKQRSLFANADLLVSTAGTALHNTLFMQAPAAVLSIMQPDWCDWAWMYTRQAQILGLQSRTYCAEQMGSPVPGMQLRQWSRHFWQQGPRFSKDHDFYIQVDQFSAVLSGLLQESLFDERCRVKPCNSNGNNNVLDYRRETEFLRLDIDPEVVETPPSLILAEVYVTMVEATQLEDDNGAQHWELVVQGELALPADTDTLQSPLASMTQLSVCISVPQIYPASICSALEDMNYYSDLRIIVHHPAPQVMFWLQATTFGGRLYNSEALIAIDVRLPDCGLLVGALSDLDAILSVWVEPEVRIASGNHVDAALHLMLSTGLALQRQIPAACMSNSLSTTTCVAIAAAVSQYLYIQRLTSHLGLPLPQWRPSARDPFIFLHTEKTAGTTLRELLVEAATRLALPYFVPCHGDPSPTVRSYVHCTVLQPEDLLRYNNGSDRLLRGVAVIAGHFAWNIWERLPDWAASHPMHAQLLSLDSAVDIPLHPPHKPPFCLIMGRHPVERSISYYYQRCYDTPGCEGYHTTLNSLSPDTLRRIMRMHRHMLLDPLDPHMVVVLDEGMEEAMCRTLSGQRVMSGMRVALNSTGIDVPAQLRPEHHAAALHNVAHCVVGLQEHWDLSISHVLHFLPWLQTGTTGLEENWMKAPRRMKLFEGQETLLTLRPDLRTVIENANTCDLAVYAKMQDLFQRQQKVVIHEKMYKNV